ncbi:MAG: hypothetical protein HYY13_08505 [Nitrospirae bacterium]|nr:hypothetical protein [Nitrospirota bacterium]
MLIFYGVPDHKIHGPGPVRTRETSAECNYNSKDNVIDIFDLAERCPLGAAISTEHLYQVLKDASVAGYSFDDLPNAVVGFHAYQQEGPNPEANAGGNRQRAFEDIVNLSCLFPNKPIWSTEGGWCDQETALEVWPSVEADCDPNWAAVPSPMALAGGLVGMATYAYEPPGGLLKFNGLGWDPGNLTCPSITEFPCPCCTFDEQSGECLTYCDCPDIALPPTAVSGLRKLFWYKPRLERTDGTYGGRGLFSFKTYPPLEVPAFHAMAPAKTLPVLLGRDQQFHTGTQRSDLAPRAYFTARLEDAKSYVLTVKAGRVVDENTNLGNIQVNPNLKFFITAMSPVDALFGTSLYPEWHTVLLPAGVWTTVIGPPETSLEAEYDFTFAVSPTASYSFALVPARDPPYVPTGGETGAVLLDQDPENLCDPETMSGPNALTLFEPDCIAPDPQNAPPVLRPQEEREAVLTFAEGAYAEGIVRLDIVEGPVTASRRVTDHR